ncbi:type VI secretion system tube protein TssD [Desulfobacula sp.]|uniref:type VI secretion system tube protein TssD n=1 Tax=Desulfobacula sp. TaxID=2593537 RepID=UPI00262D5A1D|nr:type VI secretion system tube protein TssD [Desulfobacula sp.]
MKAILIFFSLLLVTVAFLCTPLAVEAALVSKVLIEGETQGKIEGSCDSSFDCDGWIAAYSFGHNVYIPRDAQNNITGKRVHTPLKILKSFDKSTPKLYQALINGEQLEITMRFYKVDPSGIEENYFTITLKKALIISITPSYPPVFLPQNNSYHHMETVAFIYQYIKWTWESDGIESEDSIGSSEQMATDRNAQLRQ